MLSVWFRDWSNVNQHVVYTIGLQLIPCRRIIIYCYNYNLMWQFDHVYFTDIILFTVRLLVIPAPSTVVDDELTLVTMETLSTIIWRVGHMNASGTLFTTLLAGVNFTAQPTSEAGTLRHSFSCRCVRLKLIRCISRKRFIQYLQYNTIWRCNFRIWDWIQKS